jgi:predicted ATPase
MKRYVVSGAPGAGKTSMLGVLSGSYGYAVVPEAATDVIAGLIDGPEEHWLAPGFVDEIVTVQRQRQVAPVGPEVTTQLFDRSPVCTLALARWLGRPVSAVLQAELDRVAREPVYDRRVLMVRPLGFVEPTAARRISYVDSLAFEGVHEDVYRELGYELVDVPPDAPEERARRVDALLRVWA